VPATLDWGKAKDIYSSAWWCAVLRYLEQDVGARLVAINFEHLDFVLDGLLTDQAQALQLARRIAAIAGLDGSAGYTGAGELAARLLYSDRFSMWFD